MGLLTQALSGPFPLVQLTVKVTLLLCVFFALWVLSRKKSASIRHRILVLAMLSIPCLFAVQVLIPSQTLPWIEQRTVVNFEQAFDYRSDNDPNKSRILPRNSERLSTVPHSETPDGPDLTQSLQPSGVFFFSPRGIFLSIWIGGTLVMLARFATAWLIVCRRAKTSPFLDVEQLDPLIRERIKGLESPYCQFRVHTEPGQMPLCFGLFRSTILLPREFKDWSFEDQQSVILHEAAHANRRDCLVNFLAHVENAVLWFHPLSWTLLRCLKSESEMACDDWAIAKGADNVEYASALFDVTMSTKRKPTVAVVSVSMADCSPLERRMQSILSTSVSREPISLMGFALVATLSAMLIFGLAGYHLGPSVEAQTVSITPKIEIEHHIQLRDGTEVRGRLSGSIILETAVGNEELGLEQIRHVKRLDSGRHQIRIADNSVVTGIIRQSQLPISGVENSRHIDLTQLRDVTAVGHAALVAERITSGFLEDGITYHIRTPRGYVAERAYPAIVFFHDAHSNTRTMLEKFAAETPDIANRMLLIGINGENRSSKVEGGFNYTYIDFAGPRSKFRGFPGTDRQSPALVKESIEALKKRIPISSTYVLGKGDGAFLAFSVMMNFAEMIDGVITINGGLLVQCVPDAYENEQLVEAQRSTPIVMMYAGEEDQYENSFTAAAKQEFVRAGYPMKRLYRIKDERALPQIYRRTFRSFDQ